MGNGAVLQHKIKKIRCNTRGRPLSIPAEIVNYCDVEKCGAGTKKLAGGGRRG